MSFEITTAFVKEFNSTLHHMMQQKGSKLNGLVARDTIHAKSQFYDRIHPTEDVELTSRHQATPHVDTQHSRVQLTTRKYAWSDMVDSVDQAQTLINVDSAYMVNAMRTLGRRMDKTIITAFDATVNTGEDGGTPVAFPTSTQQVVDGGASLSVAKLRAGMLKLRQAEADPDMNEVICVISAEGWDSLLTDPQFINSDFVGTHPLTGGLRGSSPVLGIRFVQTQLLPKAANIRKCFMYLKRSMILSENQGVFSAMDVLPDFNYSLQVYASWAGGAVRLEDEGVVQIDIDESATFDGS